jgi:L-rhamnose mutarotase
MRRLLLLDLKDDPVLIAAYEDWHRPGRVPQRVLDSIRAAGITGLEIYRSGNRLAMVMETGPGFDAEAKAKADAADPDVAAWETLMSAFQQPLPWAEPGEKWLAAERIFTLEEE